MKTKNLKLTVLQKYIKFNFDKIIFDSFRLNRKKTSFKLYRKNCNYANIISKLKKLLNGLMSKLESDRNQIQSIFFFYIFGAFNTFEN